MKILVLTPIYPGPDINQNFTKVVHYFTQEWGKRGELVQVINLPSYFPKIMYCLPQWVKKLINKKFGAVLPDCRNTRIINYTIDNIPVLRVPLFKFIPNTQIWNNVLRNAQHSIDNYLQQINFVPDVIVAHWTEPCLYFIDALKKRFECPTVVVSHVNHIKRYSQYIDTVDLWGYRRLSCVNDFKRNYPKIHFGFRCYSGIPKMFTEHIVTRDFKNINSYVYVGMMLPRKHPDKVIDAVRIIHANDSNFKLSMLGNGSMLEDLRKRINGYHQTDKIYLPGRVERDVIISTLDSSDIFIMISEDEVFGLVYIEAMARGCIVIASKGEGMDGIIKHGENGFLVSAGNTAELVSILNIIRNMSPDRLHLISKNAINTATRLTDESVAEDYLKTLKALVLSKSNN